MLCFALRPVWRSHFCTSVHAIVCVCLCVWIVIYFILSGTLFGMVCRLFKVEMRTGRGTCSSFIPLVSYRFHSLTAHKYDVDVDADADADANAIICTLHENKKIIPIYVGRSIVFPMCQFRLNSHVKYTRTKKQCRCDIRRNSAQTHTERETCTHSPIFCVRFAHKTHSASQNTK